MGRFNIPAYNPEPIESPQNALMRGLEMQRAQQGNALQNMQLQAFMQRQQQEQQAALRAAEIDQSRRKYQGAIDPSQGPAMPFNPLSAFAAGFKPDEIKALQPPADEFVVMGPGSTFGNKRTGTVGGNQVPFKPDAVKEPTLPPIAQLQTFRDSLPQGDPRRREVQAVIDNQTRAPKYAGGGGPAGPAAATAPGAPMVDDRAELSTRLGVPVAERDPFSGMSPKAAETFKRSLYTAADKKMNDFAEASQSARAMAQDAKRFVELQGSVSMQGPIAGRVMALSSEAQDMDAITARITPQMRQPGSGATSDFDAKMFQMATVGRTKNEDANKAIADGVVLNAQVTQEREQFMRDYLTVNGHLDGAERQWKRYADKNPIFDPKSPSVPALNPARVPYQQFFGGQSAAPAAPPKPAAAVLTATNPKTGEKLQLVNGQWVPVK